MTIRIGAYCNVAVGMLLFNITGVCESEAQSDFCLKSSYVALCGIKSASGLVCYALSGIANKTPDSVSIRWKMSF